MARSDALRTTLRNAVLSSIPIEPSQYDGVAKQFVYVPPAHLRALDADSMLVAGIRGAGKSFWWHTLRNADLRQLLLVTGVVQSAFEVSGGFGQGSDETWPEKDELVALLKSNHLPRLIWKAVVLRHVAPHEVPSRNWGEVVRWVEADPSRVASVLREADAKLKLQGLKHVVLFDALDRTADDWTQRQSLLRGLLELVLELRGLRAIRAKVFVRPDMLNDPQVKAFPDASKVVAARVDLSWSEVDLYGLLFTYLGNAADQTAAHAFRKLSNTKWTEVDDVWILPEPLRIDAGEQAKVFTALAGPWMGTNRRRGQTYKWIPNHLSDAFSSVSPRSFLAALRRSAEVPEVKGQPYPLHWTGLQDGVRRASEYRVEEVAEDLPWAHAAMEMLAQVVVPCERSALFSAWTKGNLTRKLAETNLRAPLPSNSKGFDEMLRQLADVGILATLPDGRINIPDVYRVGFGLRRRGGFKPR